MFCVGKGETEGAGCERGSGLGSETGRGERERGERGNRSVCKHTIDHGGEPNQGGEGVGFNKFTGGQVVSSDLPVTKPMTTAAILRQEPIIDETT